MEDSRAAEERDGRFREARPLLPRAPARSGVREDAPRAGALRLARPGDPRGLRRHDRERQDRAVHRAPRGGGARRHPGAGDRSQGRPRQPAPDLPGAARRRSSGPGSTRTTRAARGSTPEAYAAEQAELWRRGLAEWGQGPERIRRLREAAEFAIYTPGSEAGLPLSVVASFAAPPAAVRDDADLFRQRVATTATSLLGLVGIEADPIQSREHILLASLLAGGVGARRGPRPRPPHRAGPEAAARAGRRHGPRHLLPRQGPVRAGHGAQRPPRFAQLRHLARGRADGPRSSSSTRRRASRAWRSSRSRT